MYLYVKIWTDFLCRKISVSYSGDLVVFRCSTTVSANLITLAHHVGFAGQIQETLKNYRF